MKKLVLASKSPRRKQLLREHGFEFIVEESSFDEISQSKNPVDLAVFNASGKAKEVFARLKDESVVALGCDTIVCVDGVVLGKPKDKKNAKEMLKTLSNRAHKVISGWCLVGKDYIKSGFVETQVVFRALSEKEIEDYIATGSPMDKAGAYGIQDSVNVASRIIGSYENVVGLPIKEIADEIFKAIK